MQVLGYVINPDENYNLTTEFKNLTDTKKADGAIIDDGKAIGVIELKSTKTTSIVVYIYTIIFDLFLKCQCLRHFRA